MHTHTHLWFPGWWSVVGSPIIQNIHRVCLMVLAELENTHKQNPNFSLLASTPPCTKHISPCITIFSITTYFSMKPSLPLCRPWLSTSCCHRYKDSNLREENLKIRGNNMQQLYDGVPQTKCVLSLNRLSKNFNWCFWKNQTTTPVNYLRHPM